MVYKELIEYFKGKSPKPEHTNRFIQKYQQTNNGTGSYLHEAVLQGKIINKEKGEPDQKWHLISSWYENKVKNDPDFGDKNVCYWCGFRCPELMIWIAEVCGQQDTVKCLVDKFLNNSDDYRDNNADARRKMVKKIKEDIDWNIIMAYIERKITL